METHDREIWSELWVTLYQSIPRRRVSTFRSRVTLRQLLHARFYIFFFSRERERTHNFPINYDLAFYAHIVYIYYIPRCTGIYTYGSVNGLRFRFLLDGSSACFFFYIANSEINRVQRVSCRVHDLWVIYQFR